jgi:hypothetical protein
MNTCRGKTTAFFTRDRNEIAKMAVAAKVPRERPKATQAYLQYVEETKGMQHSNNSHICHCSRLLVENAG